MSILDNLNKKEIWNSFLEYKTTKKLISKRELKYITEYIKNEKYKDICEKITKGEYEFNLPTKHLISKIENSKKRIVYTYNEDETMVLKLLSFLLYRYDDIFSPNCYSFRRNFGVKQAIYKLVDYKNINKLYSYKIDIKNYFNSVPINKLLPILEQILSNDEKLYAFLEKILNSNKAIFAEKIIEEQKGIMAGVPISSFLANVYIKDIDEYFYKENVIYARYSDDIILFGEKEKIDFYIEKLKQLLIEHGLTVNEQKEEKIEPNNKWTFLGFSYENGKIDVSEIAKKKVMGKIRRTARKIRRWMLRKDASAERAIKAMNRNFNQKFYSMDSGRELSWTRWYFPIINVTTGLEEIDHYMQQYQRYIATRKT